MCKPLVVDELSSNFIGDDTTKKSNTCSLELKLMLAVQ